MSRSQNELVLSHLKRHGRINPLQALDRYGCARLAARIRELREAGHAIDTRMVEVINRNGEAARVAQYVMERGAA